MNERKLIMRVYKNQKSNARKRGRSKPSYTIAEFFSMSKESNFQSLYDAWKVSGNHDDIPSCDRVDSCKGYYLENIEWVTWAENKRRQAADRTEGRGSSGKQCKAVLYGGVRFHSIAEACRQTGINVYYYLRTNRADSKGIRWNYER